MPGEMDFIQVKREDVDTYLYTKRGHVHELKLTKVFDVTGDFVYTELVGYKKRRRSFVITRLDVVWKDRELHQVSARGPTYLSTGLVSKQSSGAVFWSPRWNLHTMPADITKLVDEHTEREFG